MFCPPSTPHSSTRRKLTRPSDFSRLRETGQPFRTSGLALRVVTASTAPGRLGIVVPKHGHSAVERNRLKRRLREIVRTEALPEAFDIVLTCSPAAYDMSFEMLRCRVRELCARVALSAA